jgi:hypothetical protein
MQGMRKIAVAANDDCTIAEYIDNPPSVVVYEVNEKEVVNRTVRYYRQDIFEVLNDCDTVVGRKCSDTLKEQLSSKGLTPVLIEEESADVAVGKIMKIDQDMQRKVDQTCRH